MGDLLAGLVELVVRVVIEVVCGLVWGAMDWPQRRRDQKQFKHDDKPPYDRCVRCGYDLAGTLMAKRPRCPECDEEVRSWQVHRWRVAQSKVRRRGRGAARRSR